MRAAKVGGAFWTGDRPEDAADTDDEDRQVLRWIFGEAGVPDHRAAAIARIEAACYRDPFTGSETDAHHAVAQLAAWRSLMDQNRPIVAAVGMAVWKRRAMAQFLWNGQESPPFFGTDAALGSAPPGGAVAYWPSRVPEDFRCRAAGGGVVAWQVEDGFIRSSGLGAECRPPMSVILDQTGGIHFDPESESGLETLLATHVFDSELLGRAARLRMRIVAARLGKYGVDNGGPLPELPMGRRIVLAIGQVADDLSVRRGGGAGTIDGFVARVRQCEPDAFIIYRPHPDVAAGLRQGDMTAGEHADLVVGDGSLMALVERVDAVHVLSSLTGFEALLRGVPVTVHGMPFYAGWGLTRDLSDPPARRGRPLSLDALVAGALILAPRYRDPVTGLPCPVEVLVERLAAGHADENSALTGLRVALGGTRRLLRRKSARA